LVILNLNGHQAIYPSPATKRISFLRLMFAQSVCYSLSPREERTGREPERGVAFETADDNAHPIRKKSSSSPRPSHPFSMEERETRAEFRHAKSVG
jgi:hypothetical protein